jgi:hypothetical protein
MNNKYVLDVLVDSGKGTVPLKKYDIDGFNHVGAFGNEPFQVRFTNNSGKPVQVKLTLDGTDILTGEIGDSSTKGIMWRVEAYSSLIVKAWAETNKGGAKFIFTNVNNSVAVHTHGDSSSRGVIAAAVFTENHVVKTVETFFGGSYIHKPTRRWRNTSEDIRLQTKCCCNLNLEKDFEYCSEISDCSDSLQGSEPIPCCASASASASLNKSAASVGAGDFVEQVLHQTNGFIDPVLSDVVLLKYVWFDDLKEKLRNSENIIKSNLGFPGDKVIKMANLGDTPRIKSNSDEILRF